MNFFIKDESGTGFAYTETVDGKSRLTLFQDRLEEHDGIEGLYEFSKQYEQVEEKEEDQYKNFNLFWRVEGNPKPVVLTTKEELEALPLHTPACMDNDSAIE